ncbi:MAG: glycerol kinase GlpK [Planctomycetota bacterium JB042]
MTEVVAALDQGTTSTRLVLFDRDGAPLASAQKEHRQICPRPGLVEHDPTEILGATDAVVREAMARAGVEAAEIAALGITNQRETTVFWNRRTGAPYGNAIVWQDTRTAALCDRIRAGGDAGRIVEATGLPIATYFSASKIAWALAHVDGLAAAAARGEAVAGTIDAWLVWNLTGGPDGGRLVTDVTNASRTQLLGLRSLAWEDELLRAFDVPRAMLPEVVSSTDVSAYGATRPDGPFGGEVRIAGVLGDQQAALAGQLGVREGDAKNTYGTGCFLLQNTGEEIVRSRHGLLTTVAARFGGGAATYALEGSVAIAGALVQWLRDNLGLISSAPEVEALARSVDDNAGVHIVPAFSGLFAPHWRSDARGVIVGLTRHAHKGHLARAALEAVAWQTRELVDAMRNDSGRTLDALRVDGGMVANDLLMQLQADVLGVPVRRPAVLETTALGAAFAAGAAVGFSPPLDERRDRTDVSREWTPTLAPDERERRYAEWKRAVERSLGWAAS